MADLSNKPRIISRDFILTWIVSLLSGVCMRMLDSNLASYATYAWNSKSLGGYMTTFFTVGSVVMAFFSGRLNDLKGRKNCLMAGCLLYAVPAFLMTVLRFPEAVLACRLVQGLAKGMIMVSSTAIIADVVPHDHMNRGMGIYGLSVTLSFAFGPMIGLAIVGGDRYLLMFGVCGVLYLISASSCIGINYEKKRRAADPHLSPSEQTEAKQEYKGIWKLIEKQALLPSLTFLFCIAGYASIVVFLTVFSQETLGLSGTAISLYFTMAAGAMLVVRLFCSKWADRYGALILLVPGNLALICSLLILAFFVRNNYPLFLISGALYGAGNAAVYPGLNTVAVVDSPAGRSGAANATFYFMMDIGMLGASAVFGVLLDHSATLAEGYRNMFLISVGLVLICLVLSLILFNNKSRAKRNPRFAAHMERVKAGVLDK